MPLILWVILGAGALYLAAKGKSMATLQPNRKTAPQATNAAERVTAGALGKIGDLFGAPKKITRQFQDPASVSSADAAARGVGSVMGGFFKDLGVSQSVAGPRDGGTTSIGAQDAAKSKIGLAAGLGSLGGRASTSGSSTLGSEQQGGIGGGIAAQDLGMGDAAIPTLGGGFQNTLAPGYTDGMVDTGTDSNPTTPVDDAGAPDPNPDLTFAPPLPEDAVMFTGDGSDLPSDDPVFADSGLVDEGLGE